MEQPPTHELPERTPARSQSRWPTWFGLGLVAVALGGMVLVGLWRRRPVTEVDAQAFGRRVEETLARRDATFLDARLDLDGLLARSTNEAGRSPMVVDAVRASFKASGIGARILPGLDTPGATFRLLRCRQREGRWTALFRLRGADGMCTYHELFLLRGASGEVAFDDLELFVNASRLSDPGQQPEAVAHAGWQLERGRFEEALAELRGLPPELGRRRDVLLFRVRAAQGLGGLVFPEELARLEAAAEEDPGLALPLFVLHQERGELRQALRDIDLLDRAVGGDPELDGLRSAAQAAAVDDGPAAPR